MDDQGKVADQTVLDELLKQQQRQEYVQRQKRLKLDRLTPNFLEEQFQYLKDAKKSWEDMGYNGFMEKPLEDPNPQAYQSSDTLDATLESGGVKGSSISTVSATAINTALHGLIENGATQTDTVNLLTGTGVVLTSLLSNTRFPNSKVVLGVFHGTVYMDSVAAANAIPWGSSINAGAWLYEQEHSWHDADGFRTAARHFVANVTGVTHDVIFKSNWRSIGEVR